jgi:hypothetical protein
MADESELTRANSSLHQAATVNVLLQFCLALARRTGLSEVSGLSVEDWLTRQIASEHQRLLTAGEGASPARSGALQSNYDAGVNQALKEARQGERDLGGEA